MARAAYPAPRRAASSEPVSPCTGRGLASRRVTTTLVGSYPTVSPLPSASPESLSPLAVSFLCHFPSAFAVWGFPSVLPFGVRTFLEPRTARGHPACKLNCSRGSSAPPKVVPHSGQETVPPRRRTNSPHTRHSKLAPRIRASNSWSSVRLREIAPVNGPPGDIAELLGREHQARGRTRPRPRLEALARARVGSGAA